jgi:phosphoribosylanthranilate isomerase
MTRIKVCGITRWEDAMAAVELGADALGFICEPSSPRYIGDNPDALRIMEKLPPFVTKVAVYGHTHTKLEQHHCCFEAMQFVTNPCATGGGLVHIKVLRVSGREVFDEVIGWQDRAQAFLLDSYHPSQFGGLGIPVDWDLAAELRERSPLPVILAGGLTSENVAEAIERVRPYAVDVSSGVESEPGVKDHAKLEAFIRAVQAHDASR